MLYYLMIIFFMAKVKSQSCCRSLTKLITYCIEYTSLWVVFKVTSTPHYGWCSKSQHYWL